MTGQNVAFWILAIAMGTGAIGVVRSRNIVHAALFLIVVLVGAAAQYIVLLAEFVGIVQFFIYIGAIAVLFLFGIMLTRAPMTPADFDNDQRWPAAIVSVFLLGVLIALLVNAFGHDNIKLSDELLRNTLEMLAGRYPSEEFAELRPRLVWDRANDTLRARDGSKRLAVTSGGTIPDRGL